MSPCLHLLPLLVLGLLTSCARPPAEASGARGGILTARLRADGAEGLDALRAAFVAANPGYDLAWHAPLERLTPAASTRVVFVQSGAGEATVRGAREDASSALTVGDVVLLRPEEELAATGGVGALAFAVPAEIPPGLPAFVRPDWDPGITDVPGGCATEEGAYRRILLTWLEEKGPYVFHALNAHRVRITDSFTHYHPLDGGFDELYLVQMVQPAARLITSPHVDTISSPSAVTPEETAELLDEHVLAVGDLVYLPRGVAHRGLGGVLAQVITVPGFRPGAEIGLDHHLRAINERLGLEGGQALPFNAEASTSAVVR